MKNKRQQNKNNKLKIIAPTWEDGFNLLDSLYSESDIQDYIEHIIKKNETLPTNPPIYIYINRVNESLVFKIKTGYKLELETMKLFISTKKLIDKTKNVESALSLEVVEVTIV